jgi:hypothetical protein
MNEPRHVHEDIGLHVGRVGVAGDDIGQRRLLHHAHVGAIERILEVERIPVPQALELVGDDGGEGPPEEGTVALTLAV